MLKKHHTPNLVGFVGYSRCPNFLKNISTTRAQQAEVESQLNQLVITHRNNGGSLYDGTFNVLVLERPSHITTLAKWLKEVHSEDELTAVIYQVLFTLLNFEVYKLRHNDLHFGNIFVQQNVIPGENVYAEFQIKGEARYVPVNWVPLIYDFDRGSVAHPSFSENTMLTGEFCRKLAQCNDPNPKYDAFSFLCYLSKCQKFPSVMKFISDCVSQDLLLTQNLLPQGTSYCQLLLVKNRNELASKIDAFRAGVKGQTILKSELQGSFIPPDSDRKRFWMFPLQKMVQHSIFDAFKKKPPANVILQSYTLATKAEVNKLYHQKT